MFKYNLSKKAVAERIKYTIYCKCGHSVVFTPKARTNKIICTHCGYYIYKNKQEEFKELLKRGLKNAR